MRPTSTHTTHATSIDAIRGDVNAYLHALFAEERGPAANLDRWTQQRVSRENLAKLELVFEADDAREACYQDLIREIDTEADAGVFLVRHGTTNATLRSVLDEPGVSGQLYQHLDTIAPVVLVEVLADADNRLDLTEVTIQARHDRATIDATVSEIIMAHLADSADTAADMSRALRALLYAFHEDYTRRRSGLPRVMNDRSLRDLITMIAELADRAGDYRERVTAISTRADRA
jgi:hypothetical protein